MVEERICAICKENLNGAESINELPCNKNHAFHSKCINKWIIEKRLEHAKCPICRQIIFKMNEVDVTTILIQPIGEFINNQEMQRQQIDCCFITLFKIVIFLTLSIGPIILFFQLNTKFFLNLELF